MNFELHFLNLYFGIPQLYGFDVFKIETEDWGRALFGLIYNFADKRYPYWVFSILFFRFSNFRYPRLDH